MLKYLPWIVVLFAYFPAHALQKEAIINGRKWIFDDNPNSPIAWKNCDTYGIEGAIANGLFEAIPELMNSTFYTTFKVYSKGVPNLLQGYFSTGNYGGSQPLRPPLLESGQPRLCIDTKYHNNRTLLKDYLDSKSIDYSSTLRPDHMDPILLPDIYLTVFETNKHIEEKSWGCGGGATLSALSQEVLQTGPFLYAYPGYILKDASGNSMPSWDENGFNVFNIKEKKFRKLVQPKLQLIENKFIQENHITRFEGQKPFSLKISPSEKYAASTYRVRTDSETVIPYFSVSVVWSLIDGSIRNVAVHPDKTGTGNNFANDDTFVLIRSWDKYPLSLLKIDGTESKISVQNLDPVYLRDDTVVSPIFGGFQTFADDHHYQYHTAFDYEGKVIEKEESSGSTIDECNLKNKDVDGAYQYGWRLQRTIGTESFVTYDKGSEPSDYVGPSKVEFFERFKAKNIFTDGGTQGCFYVQDVKLCAHKIISDYLLNPVLLTVDDATPLKYKGKWINNKNKCNNAGFQDDLYEFQFAADIGQGKTLTFNYSYCGNVNKPYTRLDGVTLKYPGELPGSFESKNIDWGANPKPFNGLLPEVSIPGPPPCAIFEYQGMCAFE